MSSARWNFARVAAALMLAALPVAVHAGVVVSASGPSASNFPAGRKIGDADPIVLRSGDTLTVLDSRGTRVLRGAGTFTLKQQPGAARRASFAVLTERRSAQRVRTGAVRNADTTVLGSPNLWYVDVSRPGRICVPGTADVRLWRRDTAAEGRYSITDPASTARQSIQFAAGEMLAPWDNAAMAITPGRDYRIAGSPTEGEATVSFAVIEQPSADPEGLASQLIENGCNRQLELLSSALRVSRD